MAANLADRREAKNPPPPNGTINNINEIGIAGPERKAGQRCFSGVFRARLYTAAFAPAGAAKTGAAAKKYRLPPDRILARAPMAERQRQNPAERQGNHRQPDGEMRAHRSCRFAAAAI
jgi:hypothetical protein